MSGAAGGCQPLPPASRGARGSAVLGRGTGAVAGAAAGGARRAPGEGSLGLCACVGSRERRGGGAGVEPSSPGRRVTVRRRLSALAHPGV